MKKETKRTKRNVRNAEFYEKTLAITVIPQVNNYIFDNYCSTSFNLKPKQYAEIENLINSEFKFFATSLAVCYLFPADITPFDEFSFVDEKSYDGTLAQWPVNEQWYTDQFDTGSLNCGEIKDSNPDRLQNEKGCMQTHCDLSTQAHRNTEMLKNFLRRAYCHFNPVLHQYIEQYAAFDLAVCSPDGIKAYQLDIDALIEGLFRKLYALLFLKS